MILGKNDHYSAETLLVIRTLVSHSNKSDILSRVWRSGCDVLVHHLLTVVTFLPSCSANHLLVLFFSARTTFSLFKSFIASTLYDLNANIVKFYNKANTIHHILIILKRILKYMNEYVSSWFIKKNPELFGNLRLLYYLCTQRKAFFGS